MPNAQFPYDGKLSGSDLSALLLGADLGTAVEITIHRDVMLSWDVLDGVVTQFNGTEGGETCWLVAVSQYTLIWSAQITETVTKTSKPAPLINSIGEAVGDVGKVITGIGGALLTWAGASLLTPAAPAAPVGAAGAGIITGVGGVVTGIGEVLEWLTDPAVESWTTTYQESGQTPFTVTAYTQIECDPQQDYKEIVVPQNPPTYELALSACVSSVGTGLANSGLLHPPK